MIYVFCGAYKALLFALYLKSLRNEITIVTNNKDVVQYCESENINYVKFELIRPKVVSIYKVFSLKRMLDETIEKIDIGKDDKFFITGISKAVDYFYLAKELSKKGVGYYKLVDGEEKIFDPPKFKPFFIRGAILRSTLKLVMGLDLIYYRNQITNPNLGIDYKFFKKYNINEYEPSFEFEELILEAIKKSKINYKEYDNLLIDKGPFSEYVEFSSMKRLHEKLFGFPFSFAFKKHPSPVFHNDPSQAEFYKYFNRCDEIPRYIPAELFFNNVRKSVLSICSTALITASKLEHLKSIALLDLVEWHDKTYKEECRERLIKASNNKIFFPSSFDELKEILSK